MSKIGLIIKREYSTRVMKKSFILLTFLTPILLVAMFSAIIWLGSIKDDKVKTIVVVDNTNLYGNVLKSNEIYTFQYVASTFEEAKKLHTDKEGVTAILHITSDLKTNPKGATLYSEKQVNMELKGYVAGLLNTYIEEQKLASYNIENLKEMVENSRTDIDLKTIKWGDNGNQKEGSAELAMIIGMISAFVIYMFIVIYGAQVMSGVVQEKTNRIVEVIISSVKPFELMMGKIIGIALVGLTQFLMWVILTLVISTALGSVIGGNIDANSIPQMGMQANLPTDAMPSEIQTLLTALNGLDFVQIVSLFIIYFLGGYLLYASLFAAIGSAVDNETDTQQFSMPIMLPIIFAIYAGIFSAENPDGPLAFWCSMIPFTSPIVMMVRLPFDVPIWQIALSISILILSFIGTTWMAAKIYRTGILMYGKKITWGELLKWLRY